MKPKYKYIIQWHKVNFFQVWIQFFLFHQERLQSPKLITINGEKKIGCISFPSVSDMWNTNSLVKVWTRVTRPIYYNDNYYTTNDSINGKQIEL